MENDNDTNSVSTRERNLLLLINNTDDPIWYVDKDFTVIECNHSFKKWIACFVGKELHNGDRVLSDELDQVYVSKFEMCYKLALNGSTFRSVEDMKVAGELKYTAVTFNPVYDEDNLITGVSCFATDISEQRKHLYKIEEQNRVLMEIAAIESHKIRGPVATILGLGQFFNYNDLTDPVNKTLMEGILSVSEALDIVIKDVVKKSNTAGA